MMNSRTSRIPLRRERTESRLKASSSNRSRVGCLTCKQKHVKCDETRPSCRKCAQKGWTCGGYSRSLKWSYKHQPVRIDPMLEYPDIFLGTFDSSDSIQSQLESADSTADLALVDDIFSPPGLFDFGFIDIDDQQFLVNGIQLDSAESVQLESWPSNTTAPTSDLSIASCVASSPQSYSTFDRPTASPELIPALYLPRLSSIEADPGSALRLIRNWFDEVCPAWSAFDSSMNMNRNLAADLWHSSAAVFNALQSMSASFLSARLPQMRGPALNLLRTATVCIQAEVDSINGKPQLDGIPTGLLFSLFCLGTTVCWLDASRVGVPFLSAAKSLLERTALQYPATSENQVDILAFFRKSLVYWEMLVSVVDDTDLRSDIDGIHLLGPQQQPANDAVETSTDMLPHPWTGISSMTSSLFARSMRLCRTYRRRITKPTGRAISLSTAMKEIEEAQKLQEQLRLLEFSSVNQMNDTGDWRTPRLHLAHVAEAYQLASLLQLYVTFPDLVSLRLSRESGYSGDGDIPWDKLIIPLTLRLTRVLEQIPPDSGSRVIQPLLYICASTGLRLSLSPSTNHISNHSSLEPVAASSGSSGSNLKILDYIDQIDDSASTSHPSNPVSSVALDIGIARNFVMKRLTALESSLQPKPIIVAEELVKAIWAAYDEEPAGCTAIHWFDVMERRGLQSLFG